jgi:mevalonate kinase
MPKNLPNIKNYPSKIILFGEYTVLMGSHVLAMPFEKYAASWQFGQTFPHCDFVDHITSVLNTHPDLIFNESAWQDFNENQGYLYSSIPNGYGLGSSGTVVAAFFDTFIEAPEYYKQDTSLLLKLFGEMESFFHGNSSGIDPLLSYIQKPLLYHDKTVKILENIHPLLHFQLIDSGSKRYMEKLVAKFIEKLEIHSFKSAMESLKNANNAAIDALILGDITLLQNNIHTISELQYSHLKYLIPDHLQQHWYEALQNDGPKYKLCGAGGGGFYMKIDTSVI